MIEFSKPKYPTKQTINLARKDTNGIGKTTQIVLFLLFCICLWIFTKFAVIHRIEEAEHAKREYKRTEELIRALEDKAANYDEILAKYRQYDNSFLSETERIEMDRLEIIDMVEQCVKNQAEIKEINITSNQVSIKLEETALSYVSEIVARFEEDERTSYVSVSTAGTGTTNKENQIVSADVMVQLKSGGEQSNE